MAADISDDSDKLVEVVSHGFIVLVWGWPALVDKHAFGPAESLPDGLGDEWCKWVHHDENLLKSGFKQSGIFPEFLAFDEPVSVFVPDEIIDEVASFGETIVLKELLQLFAGFVDFAANPVFAEVIDDDFVGFFALIYEILD